MKILNTLSFVYLIVGITTHTALAQSTSTSTIDLPDLEVVEEKETEKEQALESIQTVDVIDKDDLQLDTADHVTDKLQEIVGVNVSGGSLPQNKKTYVRGLTGNRVLQKVDGARRFEQTQNLHGSSIGLETENLKSIQVQKGGESTNSAHGSLGGTIIYKTIDPSDLLTGKKQHASKIKATHSSASNSTSYSVTSAQKLGRHTAVLGQYIHRDVEQAKSGGIESERKDVKFDRDSYLLKLTDKSFLGDVKAKASYNKEISRDTYFRSNLPSTTTNYVDSVAEATLEHEYESKSSNLLNLSNNFYANERKSTKETHTPYREIQWTVGNTDDTVAQYGGKISNTSLIQINNSNYFETSYGIERGHTQMNEKERDSDGYYGKSSGNDSSVFAINKLSLMDSKVVLDISLRASEYERESEKLAVNVKNKSGNTFSNIIGLTLAPTPYTSFFGKLSNVNRAPEVRELYFGGGAPSSCHWPRKICSNQPNDQLSEETLYGREVGVLLKNNHRRVKLHTKVSYFYDNISDYIETMPRMYRIVDGVKVDAGPTTATHRDYSTQNLNKVNRQGIEAEIGASINEFEANAKYSAMNMDCEACPSMYDAKTVSEPIHTSPADKFTLTMAYDYDKKNLKFEYKGVFVNQQKRMSERYKRAGYESPGYSTHGVQVNWSPNFKSIGKVELDLAIDNLTDKKYKVHNSGSGEFELGRNAKIGLTKYF